MNLDAIRAVNLARDSWIDLFVDCMLANKPALLNKKFTENWESRMHWVTEDNRPTLKSMIQDFGNLMLPVMNDEDHCNYEEMRLTDFARYFEDDHRTQILYAKDWHFQRDAECTPYKLPVFLQSDWFNHEEKCFVGDYRFVYIGVKGTWTKFHCDVMNSYSWSANICGRKRWYFVPPSGEEHFRLGRDEFVADITAHRDKWQAAGVLEMIQEEGEIIFVPSSWYHQVHNEADTISINHNFINSSNIDHVADAVLHRMSEVIAEIEDSRSDFSVEEFANQVQLILKADIRIDIPTFKELLDYLIADRSTKASTCWICPYHKNVFDCKKDQSCMLRMKNVWKKNFIMMIAKALLRNNIVAGLAARVSTRSYSAAAPFDWQEARSHFSRFSGGSVTLKTDGGLATIELEHPGKKNALSGKMMVDLDDCVRRLESWNGAVVVLTGVGGDFCSGGDLEFVKQTATPEDGHTMCTFMGNILIRLRRLPAITIAKGDGYILGGGSELFSSCDIRAMNETARVGFVQGRLGVTPGWGGTTRLVELVGRSKAIELLATSSVLSATEANKISLANFVYKNEDQFSKYLASFLRNNHDVVKVAKQVVDDILTGTSLEDCLEKDRQVFEKFWGGEAHRAALIDKPKHK